MIRRGRPVWNPAAYQSSGKKGAFFEGWYFKLISADRREALALIPGVSVSPSGKQAFLQIFDGSTLEYRFIPYPFESFKPGPSTFDIALAEHRFSESGISLAHRDCSLFLDGALRFGPLSPWPVTLFSPGAMGWYGLLPFMEDYHGVLNMDTSLDGELKVDGSRYNFDGGRCYIEKDWGSGFPSAWIWMQCNSFEIPGVSITFSLARIPWKKRWFSGFIIGVLFEGRLIPFCTYNGARFRRLELTDSGGFSGHLHQGPYRLELEVQGGAKRALQAPLEGAMRSSVEESLSARCFMRLSRKKNGSSPAGNLLFQGEGERAGLEISGDMEPILRSLAGAQPG
jgi:tocopherol cyclase